MYEKGKFRPEELRKVPEPDEPRVVLKSGGPIMSVLDVDSNGNALCEWERGDDVGVESFAIESLYTVVPFVKNDVQ